MSEAFEVVVVEHQQSKRFLALRGSLHQLEAGLEDARSSPVAVAEQVALVSALIAPV